MNMAQVGPSIAQIIDEWQLGNADTDLARWREGMQRYDAAPLDNRGEMRAASELMCAALTHYIAERTIIDDTSEHGVEIGQTIWNVLVASLHGNDQTTWGPEPERHVRLALAAICRAGLQPADLGGNDSLKMIFDDRGNQMLMIAALWHLSTTGPKSFTLGDWFHSQRD
jgi:hypothetical protein